MNKPIDIFKNIIDIFSYYDRPVLFISEIDFIKYICVLVKEENTDEEWLVSDISEQTYEQLKTAEIDFYTCFKKSASGKTKLLSVVGENITCSNEFKSLELSDNFLPSRGIYSKKCSNTCNSGPYPEIR
ncbi:hypothetical protein [Legionella feeleii]|uniref:Uncharacterized protein n=1 Tax=Legionella feeleii TaxID=453 RepID=A0A378IX79_9GAMM|nr:hypothetical protein [Legionella feeleii]STX39729.1 Uncharacterised protein [Legionella feeleii]